MEFGHGRVTVNDVDLAYLATGPEDGPLALCLHGFPDSAWTWRFLAPGSRAEVVAGTGHFLHLERPDVVNTAIVDFLTAP